MTFSLPVFLLGKQLITKEQLDKAMSEKSRSRISLIDTIDYLKFADKKEIVSHLEKHFHTKYVDLAIWDFKPEILRLVPEALMKRFMLIPLEREKNSLSIAMVDPFDVKAIDRIQNLTGFEAKPVITTEDEFTIAFEKFFLNIFAEKVVGEVKLDAPREVLEERLFERASDDNKEALVIRLFNAILAQAVRARSTDIHVEPQEKELLIRFRIDGLLHTAQVLPKGIQPLLTSRIKVMAEIDIAESRLPQDGQIRIKINDRDLDLRISTIPGLYGEKIAVRVLDKSSFSYGLSQLGMPGELQSKYEDFIFKPGGIILVTGPTGSGKTTTLYSTLNRIRSPEKNILTLEDPIEYELLSSSTREGGITQVQVNPKIGLTFANGLRAVHTR